jgi:hypothetical protein
MKLNLLTLLALRRHFPMRGPAAVTCLWLWIVLFATFLKVDPSILKNILIPNIYLPVIAMLFAACFLTLWLMSRSKKISILWSSALVFFLLLRVYDMGHLLNALLLLGVVISAHVVIIFENKKSDSNEL